jgi:hypothetical protein
VLDLLTRPIAEEEERAQHQTNDEKQNDRDEMVHDGLLKDVGEIDTRLRQTVASRANLARRTNLGVVGCPARIFKPMSFQGKPSDCHAGMAIASKPATAQ